MPHPSMTRAREPPCLVLKYLIAISLILLPIFANACTLTHTGNTLTISIGTPDCLSNAEARTRLSVAMAIAAQKSQRDAANSKHHGSSRHNAHSLSSVRRGAVQRFEDLRRQAEGLNGRRENRYSYK